MKQLLIITIAFFLIGGLNAQSLERQVIGSAGKVMTGSVGSLSFTIGEVATTLGTGSFGTLQEGFQQPLVDDFVGVIDLELFETTASIFPNPTINSLRIESDLVNQGIVTLKYEVLDIQGRTLLNGNIASNNGELSVIGLANAPYVLVLKSKDGKFTQRIRFVKL